MGTLIWRSSEQWKVESPIEDVTRELQLALNLLCYANSDPDIVFQLLADYQIILPLSRTQHDFGNRSFCRGTHTEQVRTMGPKVTTSKLLYARHKGRPYPQTFRTSSKIRGLTLTTVFFPVTTPTSWKFMKSERSIHESSYLKWTVLWRVHICLTAAAAVSPYKVSSILNVVQAQNKAATM